MKLGTLLTAHRALDFARVNAPGKGLPYTDAQIDVEREIQRVLDEESGESSLRFDDHREHLGELFRRGVLRRKVHPYR